MKRMDGAVTVLRNFLDSRNQDQLVKRFRGKVTKPIALIQRTDKVAHNQVDSYVVTETEEGWDEPMYHIAQMKQGRERGLWDLG